MKAFNRFRQNFFGKSRFSKLLGKKAVAELRNNGTDASRERRWHDAARLYSRYLLEAPTDFGIWVQCGHARKESGDLDEAERCYLTALKLRSTDADLHLQLGHLYKLMGRSVDARESYIKSHQLDPSLDDARKELEALGCADETGQVPRPVLIKDRDFQQHLSLAFDHEWYIKTYSKKFHLGELTRESALAHYQTVGCQQGASPVPDFDEEFYCAFYNDIRRAKQLGAVQSGYHHFVVAGRTEGRLGRYDLKSTLEAVMPGLTMPNAFARVRSLRDIVRIPDVRNKQTARQSLFVVCPRLNPDIAFGGYKALFELILSMDSWLRPHGIDIEMIVTEEAAESVVYAIHHIGVSPMGQFLSSVPVWDLRNNLPEVGSHDRFLCYSAKDTLIGAGLARRTDQPKVLSLIQEDEAIFHPFNCFHAIVSDALATSVFPIFNSHFLVRHMRMNRRSIFRDFPDAEEGLHYCVFEHVLTRLPRQTRKQMAERTARNCVVYARPEDHAARNLYEIAEVALSNVCMAGHFGPEWNFFGIGALSDYPGRPLGGGHVMPIRAKLPLDEYARLIESVDIGISLMYAPHPSVVPFELASTGALVVTNVFANRSREDLEGISNNIIPCAPTIDGVEKAIIAALGLVLDFEHREKHILQPPATDWATVFDVPFLERNLSWILERKN